MAIKIDGIQPLKKCGSEYYIKGKMKTKTNKQQKRSNMAEPVDKAINIKLKQYKNFPCSLYRKITYYCYFYLSLF